MICYKDQSKDLLYWIDLFILVVRELLGILPKKKKFLSLLKKFKFSKQKLFLMISFTCAKKFEISSLLYFRFYVHVQERFFISWKKFHDMEQFSYSIHVIGFVTEHHISLLLVFEPAF